MDYVDRSNDVEVDEANNQDGYISVKDRTKQFGEPGSLTLIKDNLEDHKPYKYDDALKLRFPENKAYVSAQNYVPIGSIINASEQKSQFDEAKGNFEFKNISNSSLGNRFANKGQQRPYDNALNKNKFSYSGGGFNRDDENLSDDGFQQRDYTAANRKPKIGFGGLNVQQENKNKGTKASGYRNDNNKDDRKANKSQSTISNRSQRKFGSGKDYHVNRYNDFNAIHPMSVAQVTGEKAYFSMKPRVYDYDDDRYHAMSVDGTVDLKMDGRNDFSDHYLA